MQTHVAPNSSLTESHSDRQEKDLSVLLLNPADYPGGIAAWGALDPVFDTTGIASETGVHIHARKEAGGEKSIDETFDIVKLQLTDRDGNPREIEIDGEDAAAYNIAAIFKFPMVYLTCPACSTIHSDLGYDAVHPHRVHSCPCGCVFESEQLCISNPVLFLKELCGDVLQHRPINDPVERKLINRQQREKAGKRILVRYQVWGSNPAVVWTSAKLEEGGIHVHMFDYQPSSPLEPPTADETYGRVEIDGINLDPEQIRYLMAQQGLKYLSTFVQPLECPVCSKEHFDRFENAVTPHEFHVCEHCGAEFPSPAQTPLVVSNPAVAAVRRLYRNWEALAGEPITCYTG